MRAIAWNMNWKRADANWSLLRPRADLDCDIALLSEATPPPGDLGMEVIGDEVTIGRDDVSQGGKKTRLWSTYVASKRHPVPPSDVWTLPPGHEGKDRRAPLKCSRPGAWAAAVVPLANGGSVTAISLYGLLDDCSDASVHRSISDLTALLEDERYNGLLLMGGDLNTLASQPLTSRALARDQGVLDRITKGFGLIDLLHEDLRMNHPDRGRLENCKCELGDDCRHTWTFRHNSDLTIPHQDDYLFASGELAERLVSCEAFGAFIEGEKSPSDHQPLVATFKD